MAWVTRSEPKPIIGNQSRNRTLKPAPGGQGGVSFIGLLLREGTLPNAADLGRHALTRAAPDGHHGNGEDPMSSVDPAATAAAAFQERINKRLAGLRGEQLVVHAMAPYGSGPENAHGIYVIVNDDTPETQQRIKACLSSLRRPIIITKQVATFQPEPGEDTGDGA